MTRRYFELSPIALCSRRWAAGPAGAAIAQLRVFMFQVVLACRNTVPRTRCLRKGDVDRRIFWRSTANCSELKPGFSGHTSIQTARAGRSDDKDDMNDSVGKDESPGRPQGAVHLQATDQQSLADDGPQSSGRMLPQGCDAYCQAQRAIETVTVTTSAGVAVANFGCCCG